MSTVIFNILILAVITTLVFSDEIDKRQSPCRAAGKTCDDYRSCCEGTTCYSNMCVPPDMLPTPPPPKKSASERVIASVTVTQLSLITSLMVTALIKLSHGFARVN